MGNFVFIVSRVHFPRRHNQTINAPRLITPPIAISAIPNESGSWGNFLNQATTPLIIATSPPRPLSISHKEPVAFHSNADSDSISFGMGRNRACRSYMPNLQENSRAPVAFTASRFSKSSVGSSPGYSRPPLIRAFSSRCKRLVTESFGIRSRISRMLLYKIGKY